MQHKVQMLKLVLKLFFLVYALFVSEKGDFIQVAFAHKDLNCLKLVRAVSESNNGAQLDIQLKNFNFFFKNRQREHFISRRSSLTHKKNTLKHAHIDPNNLASLQRGAKYFMNFCSGCHSLQFMRYNRVADDLKISDKINSAASNRLLNNNLIFTQANPNDTIIPSLYKKNALLWFGKVPPDLSLSTRARSIDWVYNYLLDFYPDNKRPFGVNNSLVKNTIMPDPLAILRNMPNYRLGDKNNYNFNLLLNTNNNLKQALINPKNHDFFLKEVVADLVNFLAYTADPTRGKRQSLGLKVCGFLLFFSCLVFFLKKQIWKNIK